MNEIELGENCGTVKGSCEVLYMWDRISIQNRNIVESPVITTGMPVTRLLRDHVEWWVSEAQALDKRRMIPGCTMCSNSFWATCRHSGESHRARARTGGPEVVMW